MTEPPASDHIARQALAGDLSDIGRVHDWRNYISADIRGMWETFTPAQKVALARQADEIAEAETWD